MSIESKIHAFFYIGTGWPLSGLSRNLWEKKIGKDCNLTRGLKNEILRLVIVGCCYPTTLGGIDPIIPEVSAMI